MKAQVLAKPKAFYDKFERKGETHQETTHYCPGCGHGNIHKILAEALDEYNVADRTILVSPVGCSVFAYYYFDVGNIQAAHGRAPAIATGLKRSNPDSIVISYQGDGDLAAIGGAEIINAANRGENITVIFVNNAIYGMTGGQMAPTTLLGQKTTTSPYGRDFSQDGYPIRMAEMLATLEGSAFVARVAVNNPANLMKAKKAVRRAFQMQIERTGFTFVEFILACPTNWGLSPIEANQRVEDQMIPYFPLGIFKEREMADYL